MMANLIFMLGCIIFSTNDLFLLMMSDVADSRAIVITNPIVLSAYDAGCYCAIVVWLRKAAVTS